MAGRARGAISAVLDFLLHFCVKTKVEEKTAMPKSKRRKFIPTKEHSTKKG
jgi:hypothetical protein